MEDQRCAKFPIGMRVLAVDDDPTCLKVLEHMLRKCQYEVTTTDRATKALAILREDRDKFDVIISDVNMPDMDGFELLDHVGLEMDLPVIMLSAHSDRELVMKGVTHGACDYLLKPVRMEELRNIWQHVFRKKIGSRDQGKAPSQGAPNDNADQNSKRTEKWREQDDGEGEDEEDSIPDNDDPSSQKKTRIVWCIDLHQKFVAAVKHLGIDRAVPKKILELMNVEGLTRENVASHLQKYRLYLKRAHTEEQAHMLSPPVTARNSSWHMRVASLDVYRDFRSLSGQERLPSSFTPGESLVRLKSPPALSYHGIGSSGLLLRGQTQSLSSSTNTLGRIQPPVLPTNLSFNLLEGVPNSLEVNQLQQNIVTSSISQISPIDASVCFTVPAQGNRGGSIGSSSNDLMFQGNTQQSHDLGTNGSGSSSWRGAAPLRQLPSNSLPFGDSFLNKQPTLSGLNISSTSPPKEKSLIEFPSANTVSVLPEDSRRGIQSQDGLLGDVVQATTYMPMVSSADVTSGSFGQSSRQPNAICSNRNDTSLTGQFNGVTTSMQSSDAGKFSYGSRYEAE